MSPEINVKANNPILVSIKNIEITSKKIDSGFTHQAWD